MGNGLTFTLTNNVLIGYGADVTTAQVTFAGGSLTLGAPGMGGNTIVRCRKGHLFSTIWIPGASLKAVRLGWFRFQYCPVGEHWTLVRPVRDQDLSEDQRREAVEHHDNRVF